MKTIYRIILTSLILLLIVTPFGQLSAQESKDMVRVLISFRDSHRAQREQIINGLGGNLKRDLRIVPAAVAVIPREAMTSLRVSSSIFSIVEDTKVHTLAETLPWGVDHIDADIVQAYSKGAGVRVAVLDTGIDLDHPDLNVVNNVTFISHTSSGDDDHGHGTHVAGIIAAEDNDTGVIGVAPDAELFAVKVLDKYGDGYASDIISGIEWAIDNNVQIINMSFGAESVPVELEEACDAALDAGIVLVAGAGNTGDASGTGDNVLCPARYDSVIAVASTNPSDIRADDSSTGPTVELSAPGVNILSTFNNGGYVYGSGTSMASPHVAGIAALIIASGIADGNSNGLINDEVRQTLQDTADDLGDPGRDSLYGFGLVDADEAAPAANQIPVANGGPDQSVTDSDDNGYEIVTLSGSLSYDPDGNITSYEWEEGISFLGNETILMGNFTVADSPHLVTLTVTDNEDATDTDYITVTVWDSSGPPTPTPTPVPTDTPPPTINTDCFIATAASGNPDNDASVQTLRSFRDNNLLNNSVGSSLVNTYYDVSPPVAEFIDDHPALKPAVRIGLLPSVGISDAANGMALPTKIVLLGVLLLTGLAGWISYRRNTF